MCYEQIPSEHTKAIPTLGFLSSAPLASGKILIAPERLTGALRWSSPTGSRWTGRGHLDLQAVGDCSDLDHRVGIQIGVRSKNGNHGALSLCSF
jgi:hypothetical protein